MFKLTDLRLNWNEPRAYESAADIYCAIDELIWDAHRAGWDTDQGYERCFDDYGTTELFAELYCAAADLWQGLNADMTREEAIIRAEDCFSRIYNFYEGRKIYFPAQFS